MSGMGDIGDVRDMGGTSGMGDTSNASGASDASDLGGTSDKGGMGGMGDVRGIGDTSNASDTSVMQLRVIDENFTICQVREASVELISSPFCFVGKTDEELSLVCPTSNTPANTVARDDGWRMFGVVGAMEFSLVGVLAGLSKALADAGVGIFAVSTYDTDYILVKAEQLAHAAEALRQAGYEVVQ